MRICDQVSIYNWMMKGAGTITLAAGGLPVLAAWLVGLSGLPVAHRPVTDVLAEVLAVLLLVLGWRFRRGRLVVAAVASRSPTSWSGVL